MADAEALMREAEHARELLLASRREAKVEMRMLYADLTQEAEAALDAAVRAAYDGGVSKSALSRDLKESRVTITQRLRRTSAFAAPRPEPVKGKKKGKVVAKEPAFEKFELDGDTLVVNLGEDTEASVEWEHDEVADAYIFVDGAGDPEVLGALLGVYDGPLYDEANAWLKANA